MNLSENVTKLGLDASAVYKGALSTKEAKLVLSNPPDPNSAIQPLMKQTSSLDEFKQWLTDANVDFPPVQGATAPDLKAIPAAGTDVSKLTDDQVSNLLSATQAHVKGQVSLSDDQKKVAESAFAPFSLAVYAVQDITVCPNNPWIISGAGPVTISAGTVTVHPGGQILVQTAANISIQNLVKVNTPC